MKAEIAQHPLTDPGKKKAAIKQKGCKLYIISYRKVEIYTIFPQFSSQKYKYFCKNMERG